MTDCRGAAAFLSEAPDLCQSEDWWNWSEVGLLQIETLAYKLQPDSGFVMVLLSGSELFLVYNRENVSWLDLWVPADENDRVNPFLTSSAVWHWVWKWSKDWKEWLEDHTYFYVHIRLVAFHGLLGSTSQLQEGHSRTLTHKNVMYDEEECMDMLFLGYFCRISQAACEQKGHKVLCTEQHLKICVSHLLELLIWL